MEHLLTFAAGVAAGAAIVKWYVVPMSYDEMKEALIRHSMASRFRQEAERQIDHEIATEVIKR